MAANILEAQLMPASVFNTIRTFEQRTPLSADTLKSFAQIFVLRQMHLHYGVGSLHRHATLIDGNALVHQARSDDIDICNVRNIDQGEIHLTHNSLLLNGSSKFQAFEYDISIQRPELDCEFLFRLREFILAAGLAQSVAIIPIPPGSHGEELYEFQLQDEQGMATLPKKYLRDGSVNLGTAVTTGWMFRETSGGSIEILAMKKCIEQISGLHTVVKNEDLASLLDIDR